MLVNQARASNPKVTDFMCQRETLQKLITYATRVPADENDHEAAHKYPFVAADVLSCSKTITQALFEGGCELQAEDEEEDHEVTAASKADQKDEFAGDNENKMVQSILNNANVSIKYP